MGDSSQYIYYLEVQSDEVDLLRVQLLGSIKSKKVKSTDTSPPQQLIEQRMYVLDDAFRLAQNFKGIMCFKIVVKEFYYF